MTKELRPGWRRIRKLSYRTAMIREKVVEGLPTPGNNRFGQGFFACTRRALDDQVNR